MNASGTVERCVQPRVVEALGDTRIVVLQGARQVGKSTLAQAIAQHRDGLVVTLDDPDAHTFATTDPVGFVGQAGERRLLVIDEIQRVPELIIALKAAVDRDKSPGRFLVTGSANLLDLAATHESLAGRAESIQLHSFSQGELAGRRGSFIDAAFGGAVGSAMRRPQRDRITSRRPAREAIRRRWREKARDGGRLGTTTILLRSSIVTPSTSAAWSGLPSCRGYCD